MLRSRNLLEVYPVLGKSLLRRMTSPSISVTPQFSVFDEKVRILIKDLPSSSTVTAYASIPMSSECLYESFARFNTSMSGTVDMATNASIFGSYTGIEPMGLFWAMTPHASSQRKVVRFLKTDDISNPMVYNIKVYDREFATLQECRNAIDTPIACVDVARSFLAPGVKRIEVRDNGLYGTLFLPPGEERFPGIINMFGGYPGLLEYKSALQASHGFASLALAYIGEKGLPKYAEETLDLEYFERAVAYLRKHDHVNGHSGIGVVGICKGSQLALAMTTCLDGIRCVVWANGSCTASYGSLKYKDKFFPATPMDISILDPRKDNVLADCFELCEPGEIENVPGFFPFHEKVNVSYLFIVGLDDFCVPVEFQINEMERLLQKVNHPDYTIIRYQNTGHLIEPPYHPFCEKYYQPAQEFGLYFKCGGKMYAHCKSQEDSWLRVITFLKEKLQVSPPLPSKL